MMRALGLWLGVSFAIVAAASQDTERTRLARVLYVEVETVARLPVAMQVQRLPRIYRDVCPELQDMYVPHTLFGPARLAASDESPSQAADRIERAGGWPALADAGRRRCQQVLTARLDTVEPLLAADLRTGSRRDRLRALHVIGAVRATRLFEDVITALNDAEPAYAAQALRQLDDPRAIPPLILRSSRGPTQFSDTLRSLQRNRPAHPAIVGLLESAVATVRSQAAYALVESRDPSLIARLPVLVADPAPDVRRQAAYIALSFDGDAGSRARPAILTLLADPDLSVRADVAVAAAARMDRASGPVLLALVQQAERGPSWRYANLVQAIHTLTGTYFGLVPGTASPPEVRDKALADFGDWIREHAQEP